MHEFHAIVNPASGNGRTGRRWPRVAQQMRSFGLSVQEHVTRGPGDATQLARELLRNGAREIVVAGGDGTLNEVVNGCFEDRAPIAPDAVISVVPCGTGRDFSRNIEIRTLEHAVQVLQTGSIQAIDVGLITYQDNDAEHDRYFVNVADVGLGAESAARINRSSKVLGGFLSYLLGAARTIIAFRGRTARVTVDGTLVHDGPITMVVLANGRYHGGGMLLAPTATMTDGQFEILLLQDVPKWQLLSSLLPKVYAGKHVGHPAVRLLQGREVSVQAPQQMLFECDGEQPGTTDLRAVILPRALQVRVPSPAAADRTKLTEIRSSARMQGD